MIVIPLPGRPPLSSKILIKYIVVIGRIMRFRIAKATETRSLAPEIIKTKLTVFFMSYLKDNKCCLLSESGNPMTNNKTSNTNDSAFIETA